MTGLGLVMRAGTQWGSLSERPGPGEGSKELSPFLLLVPEYLGALHSSACAFRPGWESGGRAGLLQAEAEGPLPAETCEWRALAWDSWPISHIPRA